MPVNSQEECFRWIIIFGPPCPCDEGFHEGETRESALRAELESLGAELTDRQLDAIVDSVLVIFDPRPQPTPAPLETDPDV
jgi:hypothetical protein